MARTRKNNTDASGSTAQLLNRKAALNSQPDKRHLAQFIRSPLSPFHSYTDGYVADDESKKYGGKYHRSELSNYKDNNKTKFTNKKMQNGERAHYGAYANNFERVGDAYQYADKAFGSALKVNTTPGDATLFDSILQFEQQRCRKLIELVGSTTYIKPGFYNQYPCVMVHIKKSTIHKNTANEKAPSAAAFEAWVNFLLSSFVGLVNYHANNAGLTIEIVRRSSFGFLSPTVAETSESFRINLGIVPEEYLQAMAKALKSLDKFLQQLNDPAYQKQALLPGSFYGSKAHKDYLGTATRGQYETPKLNDLFELLWQKVEKAGKTAVQNMMRTAFCHDGIAAEVFKALQNNPENTLLAISKALEWAVLRMKMQHEKLHFDESGTITYPAWQARASTSNDHDFWDQINKIILAFKKNFPNNVDIKAIVVTLKNRLANKKINGIYKELELLNEFTLATLIETLPKNGLPESGYGSDSEYEDKIPDGDKIYHKKIIVSNGMRAVLATIDCIGQKLTKFSLFNDATYYEVPDGIELLKKFENKNIDAHSAVTITDATAYLLDVNACVTNGRAVSYKLTDFLRDTKNKTLVLDVTSATTAQVKSYIDLFSESKAKCLFLVSSGLKHEQLGMDRNAYGTIRIFTKNKKLLDKYYQYITSQEPNVNSPFSHALRRQEKKLGAVPTVRAYLKK